MQWAFWKQVNSKSEEHLVLATFMQGEWNSFNTWDEVIYRSIEVQIHHEEEDPIATTGLGVWGKLDILIKFYFNIHSMFLT